MIDRDGNNRITEVSDLRGAGTEQDKEKRLGLSMLAKVALAVVVISSLVISVTCVMKFNELEKQKKELESKLEEYNAAIDELQDLVNAPMDEEYIIRVAKEKLGYYFPDEEMYH